MAVAHSAASESHGASTGSTSQTSFNWTHTQTGTPQGVLVFVHTISASDFISSVTYGTVTLERVANAVAIDATGEPGRTDLFFTGSGLPSGNQTVTVNRTNNATTMYASAATVTAATDVNVTGIQIEEDNQALAPVAVDDGSPGTNSVRYAATYYGANSPAPAGTGSTLLTSIDLGSFGNSMVRETTAGQGARNVGFNAASDDVAAIYVAVRELFDRTETPIVGAFTLTGNDATLTKASPKVMDGGTGAVTLAGQPADLRHNPDLEAGVGAFTLSGQPADARHNVRIEAGTGAFSLTGQPATLTEASPKAITADTGAFTLTGNPATVRRGYALAAATGTFTAAGQPATPRHNPRIEASAGSFALSGGAPALLRGRYLSGGAGTFIETGQPATFRRTWAVQAATGTFALTGNPAALTAIGAYEIDPIAGAFTFTGQPAALAQSRSIPAATGTYALTGNPATLRQNHSLAAATGIYTVTGNPATLTFEAAAELPAASGTFTLTGGAALFTRSRAFSLTTGTYNLTGNPATLALGGAPIFAVSPGTFTLTGNPAAFNLVNVYNLDAAPGNLTLTGAPATFTYNQRRRVILIF